MNIITLYFVLDAHHTTFFSSHLGHCILVLRWVVWHFIPTNLVLIPNNHICVTKQIITFITCISLYIPELEFLVFLFLPKYFLQFLFRFPPSKEILKSSAVPIVLPHNPRRVLSSTSTLWIALWSRSSYDIFYSWFHY
jgi:hypothetical protein